MSAIDARRRSSRQKYAATPSERPVKPLIPTEVLRPYLVDVQLWGRSTEPGKRGKPLYGDTLTRRVNLILAGHCQHVSFPVADRIITAVLGRPDLWQLDPALNALWEEV